MRQSKDDLVVTEPRRSRVRLVRFRSKSARTKKCRVLRLVGAALGVTLFAAGMQFVTSESFIHSCTAARRTARPTATAAAAAVSAAAIAPATVAPTDAAAVTTAVLAAVLTATIATITAAASTALTAALSTIAIATTIAAATFAHTIAAKAFLLCPLARRAAFERAQQPLRQWPPIQYPSREWRPSQAV